MNWELEDAGDDAVTLHREDGLVLSAGRVADDARAPDRPWVEWIFSVTDGDTGEQLTEHGWEIVDDEHLWEVLDGFTYRFKRENADVPSADDSATATAGTPPAETNTGDGPADETTESADGAPEDADDGTAIDGSAGEKGDGRPATGPAPSGREDTSAGDSTVPAARAEPTADPESDPAGAASADSDPTAERVAQAGSGTSTVTEAAAESAGVGAGEPTDDPEREADPSAAERAAAEAPSESARSASSTEQEGGRDIGPDATYRPARPADADELAAVYRSAYAENRELGFPAAAESATADDVREWIEAHGVLVAVVGGDVVGGVRLEETDPTRVKLSRLAVRDDRKGRGIGSELLARAEAAVDAGRADTVWLTTPEDHPYLADMYRERGYERAGEYPLENRDYDEIVMEKRLA